ncbi:potassium channel family protein [Halospeciosus flavus]|uniref:Potassium channel family protein n=1 Tax=Halospeciosus flavus TaxID=3032283 RepID=A0ABD5Z5G1_9EURY|nr:NAD-binding protein [Halospeciosus flavus]
MDRQQRRIFGYLGFLVAVVAAYTLAYDYGMSHFEGQPVTLVHAFHVVLETLTTTGYGEDAPWRSPVMLLLVDSMMITGLFFLFLTLPLFVVPWIGRRMEVRPPSSVDFEDHVVVCGFTARGETVVEELAAQNVPYVVVEPDRDRAQDLLEEGHDVIVGKPGSTDTLQRAAVTDARAVVLDAGDEANATAALSVEECLDTAGVDPSEVQVVGFVDDPSISRYLRYAGADRVLSPNAILGRSLADKVTSAITAELGETVDIGDDFEVVEMPIQRGSPLDGTRLAESGIREETSVDVVGAWFEGEFVAAPDPQRELDRTTILLVAGDHDALESLKDLTLAEARQHERGGVIVGGYGEVGSAVVNILDGTEIETTVVDVADAPGVDVVGDVTDEETLREAGIDDANALILALGDDVSTIFGTLVGREISEDVEIICRANESESTSKLYAAGADYVLSLADVSGRMLASAILGEHVMTLDKQVDIVRTEAPNFVGRTFGEEDIRARTGCTVVAVERDGEVLTELGPDFRIQEGDDLVIAGTDRDIARFNDVAGVEPEPT